MSRTAKITPLRLPETIHAAGRRRARRQGLAFPEYIRRLIRRDLAPGGDPNANVRNRANHMRINNLDDGKGSSIGRGTAANVLSPQLDPVSVAERSGDGSGAASAPEIGKIRSRHRGATTDLNRPTASQRLTLNKSGSIVAPRCRNLRGTQHCLTPMAAVTQSLRDGGTALAGDHTDSAKPGKKRECRQSGSPLVTIREVDSTAQVRALSEGRAARRVLPTVPLRDTGLRPVSRPVEWLFAVRLDRRSACGAKMSAGSRPRASTCREAKP